MEFNLQTRLHVTNIMRLSDRRFVIVVNWKASQWLRYNRVTVKPKKKIGHRQIIGCVIENYVYTML